MVFIKVVVETKLACFSVAGIFVNCYFGFGFVSLKKSKDIRNTNEFVQNFS